MGELGKRIVDLDRPALIEELLRAYADEWFAHYNYFLVAHSASGIGSPSVRRLLRRKSDRALVHAHNLAARLDELGAQPTERLGDLQKVATDKPFKLPSNVRDLDGLLKAVLDAERTSIRTYQALGETVKGRDLITERLAARLLREAVAGEAELERLLDSPAPEMTGQ
jgi:bacterioferritin